MSFTKKKMDRKTILKRVIVPYFEIKDIKKVK